MNLRVGVAKTRPSEFLNAKVQKKVEPGIHPLPKQTLEPPKLYVNVFHEDLRLHTFIMNESFTSFLHW